MGFFGDLFGGTQAKAIREASRVQSDISNQNRALGQEYTTASLGELDKALADAMGQLDTGASAANAGYDKAAGYLSPYSNTGGQALSQIANLLGLNGAEAAATARNGFQTSPGYDFRLSQGVQALDRSASARGGLYSGAAGKALEEYGQGIGSQEYNNYLSSLAGLAGVGQSAAGSLSNLAVGQGSAMGDFATNKANALLGNANSRANVRSGGLSAINGANTEAGQATAGGLISAANAKSAGANNVLSTILGIGKLALGGVGGGGLSGASARLY